MGMLRTHSWVPARLAVSIVLSRCWRCRAERTAPGGSGRPRDAVMRSDCDGGVATGGTYGFGGRPAHASAAVSVPSGTESTVSGARFAICGSSNGHERYDGWYSGSTPTRIDPPI